jgi:hypothetical protein
MSAPEQIIADFIKYNRPYIKEIKETNSELDAAIIDVLNELTKKFLGVEPKKSKEGEIEQPMNLYNVGDMVETLTGEYEGVGEIKSATWSEYDETYEYTIKVKGRSGTIKQLEENIFTLTELEEVVEETEYSNLSVEQLEKLLEENKGLIEILDDPEDPDQVEAESNIEQIEFELERRK